MLQIVQVTKEINLSINISCRVVSMECGTVVTSNQRNYKSSSLAKYIFVRNIKKYIYYRTYS